MDANTDAQTVLVVKISVHRPVAGLTQADDEALRLTEELGFVQSLLAVSAGCRATRMIDDYLVACFQDCDEAFNAARALQQTCTEPGRSATLSHLRMLLDRQALTAHAGDSQALTVDSEWRAQLIRRLPPDWVFATGAVARQLSATLRCRFHPCGPDTLDEVDDVSDLHRAMCHEDATTRIAMPVLDRDEHSASRTLCLRWRKNTLTLEQDSPQLTLGRGEQTDIKIESELASRIHARLGFQQTNFILADQSTNGTFVQIDDAPEVFLHHDQIVLRGRGVISLGRRISSGRGKLIYFSLNA
jgi:hypothetical protein